MPFSPDACGRGIGLFSLVVRQCHILFYVVWGCGHTGDVCKKNPVFHSCFFDALCHMCVNSRYDGNPVSDWKARHPSVHVSLTLSLFEGTQTLESSPFCGVSLPLTRSLLGWEYWLASEKCPDWNIQRIGYREILLRHSQLLINES